MNGFFYSGEQVPVLRQNQKPNPEALNKIHETLVLLEQYLEGHFFAIGNRVTIADFALVATVSTFEAIGVDLMKYSNVKRWLVRCQEQMTGYDEVNGKPAQTMGQFAKPKLRIWIKYAGNVLRDVIFFI